MYACRGGVCMTFGERLAYYRKEKGMSQRRVAERLGYATQTVFKYERDMVSGIPLNVVERIADVLEIPPAVLCGWETGDDIRLKNALNKSYVILKKLCPFFKEIIYQ